MAGGSLGGAGMGFAWVHGDDRDDLLLADRMPELAGDRPAAGARRGRTAAEASRRGRRAGRAGALIRTAVHGPGAHCRVRAGAARKAASAQPASSGSEVTEP